VEAQVNLRVLGGPTPRGTWLAVSELPQLALDSQYVVFLRNTDWTFSPIVGNLAFRVETIAGREVLVNPDGRAVTGWGENGPLLSAGTVSEEVGNRLHGYRGTDTRDHGQKEASGTPDPKGEVTRTDVVIASQPATQGRPPDSMLARAPSAAEIRNSGMFERPAVSGAAIADEPTVSLNSLVGAIKAAAEKDRIQIGGRGAPLAGRHPSDHSRHP
jgi:hypothetical protein